ncbi:acyltransferase [Pseudomonas sp. B33.4]|uniref:acyltransferase family protein n=1 Tax=Pseudomonas sp. B33.4 TaxID=3104265 RepID=UPI002ADECCD7|nr:acyltransferase [Pseudomonas sp. B33.4]
MNGSHNLQNIQFLRFIAAILVVAQHAVYFSSLATDTPASKFLSWGFGDLGVFVFFVISGFVIAMQTDRKPAQFMLHRILRIYPGYIAAIIFSTTVLVIFSGYRPSLTDTSMSIFLIPTGSLNVSFQVPYWTLIYEMFFYALILMLMTVFRGHKNLIDSAVFLWLLVMIFQTAQGVTFNVAMPTLAEIPLSPLNIYFIAGFFLSRILLSEKQGLALFALFLIAVSSIFIPAMKGPLSTCALTIVAIIWAIKSAPLPKFLNNLGDYSYGIYLAHLPIIYCVYWAVKDTDTNISTSILWMVIAALPIAILFGKIEHQLYRTKIRPGIDNFIGKRMMTNQPQSDVA